MASVHTQSILQVHDTGRVMRRLAGRTFARLSRVEHPFLARPAIALWRAFGSLDLGDSQKTRFASVHACFTRELKSGARPIDSAPGVAASPCDGIVGACGEIEGDQLIQAKGFAYTLPELLVDRALAARYGGGQFVTLRLTPSMYHRFHAPHDCAVERLIYVQGDARNVNPATLARVPKVFCRNERAVIATALRESGMSLTLVTVAAILVSGLRLRFADLAAEAGDGGPREIACRASFEKGQEMGWFEHGSTIIVIAPRGCRLCPKVREGARIRVGQRLLDLPAPA